MDRPDDLYEKIASDLPDFTGLEPYWVGFFQHVAKAKEALVEYRADPSNREKGRILCAELEAVRDAALLAKPTMPPQPPPP
jgi:hypothetical protein